MRVFALILLMAALTPGPSPAIPPARSEPALAPQKATSFSAPSQGQDFRSRRRSDSFCSSDSRARMPATRVPRWRISGLAALSCSTMAMRLGRSAI